MSKIRRTCAVCIRKQAHTAEQIMSPLPVERIQPAPAFTNICIDYFGPYIVRGEVQKRVRMKCYGVIMTCLAVRAVYIDIAAEATTDSFIQVLRRFATHHGWPKKVFSDGAKHLVSASKELQEQINELNKDEIQHFGRQNRFDFHWKFSPADSPWYNGTAESLIKSAKKALEVVVGESVLSFSELQTVMFEAAQLINQRPIGLLPGSPDEGTYLCPNDLLLGRATPNIPQGKKSQARRCGIGSGF